MSSRKLLQGGGAGSVQDRSTSSKESPDEIRAGLESRGVPPSVSVTLAARLQSRLGVVGVRGPSRRQSYDLLLDGVADALRVLGAETPARPSSEPDLREIERLMDAFVGELSKLDEILDVLTAHVDRMRSRSARAEDGTVH